ncbi:MAG: hypothetical protein ACRDGL_03350 [Candidatus Limnocylindrales bacterium]
MDAVAVSGPSHVGEQSLLGVDELRANRGDTVELVSAQAVGGPREGVTAYVLRLVETGGGGVGGISGDLFGDGLSFSRYAKPLSGFTFKQADGPIQVVMRVVLNQPGAVSFSAVDVTFRIDGGSLRVQELPTQGRVCFDDPTPATC